MFPMTPPRPSPFAFRLLAGALSVALLAGATALAARRAESLLRADLLLQARLIALSLCPEHVAKLTGTAADYTSPDYLHVHELLTRIRNATPHCRFLYLMERRPDGVVIFTDDSDPFDSKDHSPPGQTYDEAPAELHTAFAANQAVVRGPYGDRWGTWVSSFVPLSDPKSTMLGMDIDARDWKRKVALRAALPAVLAAIAILVGLFAALLHQNHRSLHRRAAALRLSEQSYRNQFACNSSVMLLIDPVDGTILDANAAAAEFYGYPQEQLLSMHITDINTLPASVVRQAMASIPQKLGRQFEFQHRLADGSVREVQVSSSQIQLGQRNVLHSIIYDITERKQAEEKNHALLKESEKSRRALLGILEEQKRAEEKLHKIAEQFRTLAEVAPAGIYLCDPAGNYLYANPAWCGMAGLSAEEACGKGWAAGLHPEDRNRIVASWEHMVESHGQWGLEYRFQTREGKVTWVYGLATPQYDATGKVAQYVGINLDITERKREDDVLAFLAQSSSGGTKEPFFSALARYLAQLLDMDFVCIDRLEGDGLNARTVAVWHDGRFEDNVTYALKDTPCGDMVGKQVCCFPASVCQFFPRDQVLKDLRAESYIGVTLFGHTGKPVGLIAVIGRGPLTNRPLAEAVLKLVAVRAAGEIERQDAELERQKLDKLQSVGTLAGGIAHDFNNILLGLFGNISLAMDDLPKEHPSYAPLAEADRSMSRAVRLTKQLLTFAKGGDPVKESVSVGAMVEEVARFDLTGSNVSLVCLPAEDLWPVDADRGQLQQVISNLVINARQAMPNGGHLRITLENADLPAEAVAALRPGRYIKVIIRDEGCGIAPTLLGRIFDPYFTTKQTGNGLGLATVWSIINKHNGHIGVASELGQGTTFTFYLPAAASRLPEEIKPLAAECPSTARPAKILVMDDEDSVSRLVVRMLTPCGYSVATAPDAQEALKLYKQALGSGTPYDAVILDLTIPGGPGGKEVIKGLLALDPRVQAIVSSGYAEDPIMADPAAYGFKGTVAKPYTANALREAVARVLA
jgi:PAS domain S-box-containing protein